MQQISRRCRQIRKERWCVEGGKGREGTKKEHFSVQELDDTARLSGAAGGKARYLFVGGHFDEQECVTVFGGRSSWAEYIIALSETVSAARSISTEAAVQPPAER